MVAKKVRRSSKKFSKKRQAGGAAPACLSQISPSQMMYGTVNSSVAGGSLDGQYALYGEAVPLGHSKVMSGGGCGCGDAGTGGTAKSETFKGYMSKQMGGGYSVNSSGMIAGRPVISGYEDTNPPALVGGKLLFDAGLCGQKSQVGGRRRKSKKSKKSKKSRKSRKQRGGGLIGYTKFAPYDDAFNTEPSNLDLLNVGNRNYAARQPYWGPDAL